MNKVHIEDLGLIDLENKSLGELKELIKASQIKQSFSQKMLKACVKEDSDKGVINHFKQCIKKYINDQRVLIDEFKQKKLSEDTIDSIYTVIYIGVDDCPELGHIISTEVQCDLSAAGLIFYILDNYGNLSEIQMALEFYDSTKILAFDCDTKKSRVLNYEDLKDIALKQDLEFLVGI